MSSPPRALLFLTPLLGLAAVFYFASRNAAKPAASVEPPSVSEDVRTAPEPSQPALPEPVLPRPAQAAAASASGASGASGVSEATSADALAAEMHALEDLDPERALEMAQRGQALWPTGPRAPEFAATQVKCLYRLGKPSEGRGAAEAMVNQYPSSPWALEVERQTGAHPHVDH